MQTNRKERLERLRRTAARQLRVVSRAQLRAAGWTSDEVDHEIRFGRWHAPAPRVVALQNAPLIYEQRLWLGVLHAGNGAALTHLTACVRAGLAWTTSEVIDVLTPKGDLVSPLEGFRFRQTRRPYDRWVLRSDGIPRLRVETAALLAAERDRSLRRAIGLLPLHDIAGGAQSFAEIDIGRLCTEAGLVPPTRQRIRLDKEGRRRYLDCEWQLPDGRVVVLEVDRSFHMQTSRWWQDMKRERGIVVSGRTVLRCSSVEIRLEPADILDDLIATGVPRLGDLAA